MGGFNGSGVYNRFYNWVTDKTNLVPVTASRSDTEDDGFATGLSSCLVRDGQQTATARIPFALGTSAMAGALAGVGYSFSNDPNTGAYSPAADQVALAAGGVQVLLATSTAITPGALIWGGMGAVPVGAIMPFAGTSAPSGWLLCYGQSLDRTTYAALFAAIGTTYGTADGTHFNAPDYRGRVPAGKGDMGGSDAARLTASFFGAAGTGLGNIGGAESNTLTTAQLASHSHTGTTAGASVDHTHVAPDHTHAGGGLFDAATTGNINYTVGGTTLTFVTAVNASGGENTGSANSTLTTGGFSADHTHTITTATAGSGSAHNNTQPTIICNYIIFAGV